MKKNPSPSTKRIGTRRRKSVLVQSGVNAEGRPVFRPRNPKFFEDLLGICRKDPVNAYEEMVAAAHEGKRVYPSPEIKRLAYRNLPEQNTTSPATHPTDATVGVLDASGASSDTAPQD